METEGWLVVSASWLPLAEQLPLLPVVDGLRQLHLVEGAACWRTACRTLPPTFETTSPGWCRS